MKKLINLTLHPINIVGGVTIQPSGAIARCVEQSTPVGEINGIPVKRTAYGNVEGLPDAVADTYYIVSALVRQSVTDRTDVLSPGTLVRDNEGGIIGCSDLISN